jgi:hypothetical protein
VYIRIRWTGYFPGAQDLTLRLVYDKDAQGKLLGAQAFGHAGVEKRVDAAAVGGWNVCAVRAVLVWGWVGGGVWTLAVAGSALRSPSLPFYHT